MIHEAVGCTTPMLAPGRPAADIVSAHCARPMNEPLNLCDTERADRRGPSATVNPTRSGRWKPRFATCRFFASVPFGSWGMGTNAASPDAGNSHLSIPTELALARQVLETVPS